MLSFFNSNGDSLNCSFDIIYKTKIYLPKISVELNHTYNIYILEKIFNDLISEYVYAYPQENDTYLFYELKNGSNFYIYQFDESSSNQKDLITKLKSNNIIFDWRNPYATLNGKTNIDFLLSALKLNIGFYSEEEGVFDDVLYLYKEVNDIRTLIAEFTLYTEVESEDKRLAVHLNNIGLNLDYEDYFFIKDIDVDENNIDYRKFNAKKREFLTNIHNLKNYKGSYKGLKNYLSLLGWNDITIKEWYKNDFENRLFLTSYSKDKLRYTKTGDIILALKLNDVVSVDEDGIFLTEYIYPNYENDLQRLNALSQKIDDEYLPLNASIVDITGELNFYSKNNITHWYSKLLNIEKQISVNANFDITFKQPYLYDLRKILSKRYSDYFWEQGLKKRNQLNVIGVNSITLPLNLDGIEKILLDDNIFVEYELNANVITFDDIVIGKALKITYITDENSNQLSFIDTNGLNYLDLNNQILNGTLNSNVMFDWENLNNLSNSIDVYNNIEYSVIGCPITLTNESFNNEWDDLNNAWEFANFIFDNNNTNDFYEIEWNIKHEKWSYNKKGNINELNEIYPILPYLGEYTIELLLYSSNNDISKKTKYFNVENKDIEILFFEKKQSIESDFTSEISFDSYDDIFDEQFFNETTFDACNIQFNTLDFTFTEFDEYLDFNNLRNLPFESLNNYSFDDLIENYELDYFVWNDFEVTYDRFDYEWELKDIRSNYLNVFNIFSIETNGYLTIGDLKSKKYRIVLEDNKETNIKQVFDENNNKLLEFTFNDNLIISCNNILMTRVNESVLDYYETTNFTIIDNFNLNVLDTSFFDELFVGSEILLKNNLTEIKAYITQIIGTQITYNIPFTPTLIKNTNKVFYKTQIGGLDSVSLNYILNQLHILQLNSLNVYDDKYDFYYVEGTTYNLTGVNTLDDLEIFLNNLNLKEWRFTYVKNILNQNVMIQMYRNYIDDLTYFIDFKGEYTRTAKGKQIGFDYNNLQIFTNKKINKPSIFYATIDSNDIQGIDKIEWNVNGAISNDRYVKIFADKKENIKVHVKLIDVLGNQYIKKDYIELEVI